MIVIGPPDPEPVLPRGSFAGRNVAFPQWAGYTGNLPLYLRSAAGAGHFNPEPDFDGVLRRVPMLAEFDGAYYESLSLAMVRAYLRLTSGQAPAELLSPANLLANVVALFPAVVVTDPLLGVGRRVDLVPVIWTLRVLFTFYLAVTLVLMVRQPARLLPVLRDHVYHPEFHGSFSLKVVLPAMVPDVSYEGLVIFDGMVASVEIARLLFVAGKVREDEQARVRGHLLAYCKRDTWAMVKLLAQLRHLAMSR